jgi:hypothetical protein
MQHDIAPFASGNAFSNSTAPSMNSDSSNIKLLPF